MENRRPITEDDAYLTELLIAKSYGKLKNSVVTTSVRTLGSVGETVGGTVKTHPCASAGTAIGAGVLLFLLTKLLSPGRPSRKRSRRENEERRGSSPGLDLLGLLAPFVFPYLTAYIGKILGVSLAKDQD